MPRFQKVELNGHVYMTDAKIDPVEGDLAYFTDMFNNTFIVRVLGNDGMYISYRLDDDKVRHALDAKKIVASSDIRLGLPAIKEEMLPYVSLVELVHKMWLTKKEEKYDIICTYDVLADCITIHANDDKLWEMLIFKAKGKYMLTNIKIENGEKKKISTTEYERLLSLLATIFNL